MKQENINFADQRVQRLGERFQAIIEAYNFYVNSAGGEKEAAKADLLKTYKENIREIEDFYQYYKTEEKRAELFSKNEIFEGTKKSEAKYEKISTEVKDTIKGLQTENEEAEEGIYAQEASDGSDGSSDGEEEKFADELLVRMQPTVANQPTVTDIFSRSLNLVASYIWSKQKPADNAEQGQQQQIITGSTGGANDGNVSERDHTNIVSTDDAVVFHDEAEVADEVPQPQAQTSLINGLKESSAVLQDQIFETTTNLRLIREKIISVRKERNQILKNEIIGDKLNSGSDKDSKYYDTTKAKLVGEETSIRNLGLAAASVVVDELNKGEETPQSIAEMHADQGVNYNENLDMFVIKAKVFLGQGEDEKQIQVPMAYIAKDYAQGGVNYKYYDLDEDIQRDWAYTSHHSLSTFESIKRYMSDLNNYYMPSYWLSSTATINTIYTNKYKFLIGSYANKTGKVMMAAAGLIINAFILTLMAIISIGRLISNIALYAVRTVVATALLIFAKIVDVFSGRGYHDKYQKIKVASEEMNLAKSQAEDQFHKGIINIEEYQNAKENAQKTYNANQHHKIFVDYIYEAMEYIMPTFADIGNSWNGMIQSLKAVVEKISSLFSGELFKQSTAKNTAATTSAGAETPVEDAAAGAEAPVEDANVASKATPKQPEYNMLKPQTSMNNGLKAWNTFLENSLFSLSSQTQPEQQLVVNTDESPNLPAAA